LKFLHRFFKNIKLHRNPSIGSQVVPQRKAHGQTDTMKLKVIFHSFVSAPKIQNWLLRTQLHIILEPLSLSRRIKQQH